ncbi:hypothetical protein KBC04_05075 [Candidatus Babeliales bacterium]|nr:hypothetical protein [Candidatus Babeliales bacterium]MBP9844236.1 hypothetical protein [Candidatus Babeliales bacterium]
MKPLFNILFLLSFFSLSIAQQHSIDYQDLIQPYVATWQNESIAKLSTQEIITMADMLLLSYQVVEASVVMSQARLIIQTELFNIITLSINDSIDVRLQAQNNDLTAIKKAITVIEQAQDRIKFACNTLKNFGPLLIHMDPSTIQLFIANIKTIILHWAKTQGSIIAGFEEIEHKVVAAPNFFHDVKKVFEDVCQSEKVESYQLIQGTNNLNDMYKKIELIYADLTIIRQESIGNFNTLLTLYFKHHYQLLYDYLQNVDPISYKIMATPDHKLPNPETVFILA